MVEFTYLSMSTIDTDQSLCISISPWLPKFNRYSQICILTLPLSKYTITMGHDYYNILGLTRSAGDADIKKALVSVKYIIIINIK